MAEPVLCLSNTDCDSASMSTDGSNPFCVFQLFEEPSLPAPPSSSPNSVPADGTVRLASSVFSMTVDAKVSGSSPPSPEGQLDHIESLLRSLPDDLTLNQECRAEEFIRACANVFSRSEFDIGRTNIIPHHIDTGDNGPQFEQLRRHPTAQLPAIDEHVQHMLEHDVIEPAASP